MKKMMMMTMAKNGNEAVARCVISRLRLFAAIICVMSLSPSVFAGDPPTVEIPSELAMDPGEVILIEAKTNGKCVRWATCSKKAKLIPLNPEGTRMLFNCKSPEVVTLFAWTALGDVPSSEAKCVITVGVAPIPTPGPIPPVPPNPVPPPAPTPPAPAPADPLTGELRLLYDRDVSAAKSLHLDTLIELYRQAQPLAISAKAGTAGALAELVRQVGVALLPPDALGPIRQRIAAEVAKSLPVEISVPLDAAARQKAQAVYLRIETALRGVK